MSEIRHATHGEVPPLIDRNSKVLVLGSMLSPKSAEAKFYYAHPQNRFWRVISAVFGTPFPENTEERKNLVLAHGIALWDVISDCKICGASDSSIKDVVYNDIAGLLSEYPNIKRVYTTGGKAHELLLKYNKSQSNGIIAAATRLPSTSPLNCAIGIEELVKAYSVLKD